MVNFCLDSHIVKKRFYLVKSLFSYIQVQKKSKNFLFTASFELLFDIKLIERIVNCFSPPVLAHNLIFPPLSKERFLNGKKPILIIRKSVQVQNTHYLSS